MRNGMSVREIYDALDERDRLRECLKEERRKREMLEHHIHNACWKLTCVCGNYRRIASGPYSAEDRFEFGYRAKGLEEAMGILRGCTEDAYEE